MAAPGGLRAGAAQRAARRGRARGKFRELLARRPRHRGAPRRRPRSTAPSTSNTTCATPARSSTERPGGGDRHEQDQSTKTVIRAQLDKTLGETELPRAGREVRGQGARLLRARRPPDADRDRPHQRVRRRAGDDPVQGPGAEPDGRVLVRGDRRPGPQPRHQRPRSGGDGGARVPAAAGRVRHARLPDRRDVDVDLDALREGRAHASAATSCPRA